MRRRDNGRAPLWPAEASGREGDDGDGSGHHDVSIAMMISGDSSYLADVCTGRLAGLNATDGDQTEMLLSSSSSNFAAFKSAQSNPSVNQA